jgi:hypothetical protein
MDNLTEINPKTGYHDGRLYTFGRTKVSRILAEKIPNGKLKIVTKTILAFEDGLKSLAKTDKFRKTFYNDWKNKYLNLCKEILTIEEGQTFLANYLMVKYKKYCHG